jgi:hypothetical protein
MDFGRHRLKRPAAPPTAGSARASIASPGAERGAEKRRLVFTLERDNIV